MQRPGLLNGHFYGVSSCRQSHPISTLAAPAGPAGWSFPRVLSLDSETITLAVGPTSRKVAASSRAGRGEGDHDVWLLWWLSKPGTMRPPFNTRGQPMAVLPYGDRTAGPSLRHPMRTPRPEADKGCKCGSRKAAWNRQSQNVSLLTGGKWERGGGAPSPPSVPLDPPLKGWRGIRAKVGSTLIPPFACSR